MRTRADQRRLTLVIALVIVLAATMLSGCVTIQTPPTAKPAPAPAPATTPPATAAFKAGDRVAAPWGGAQYIGTVQNVTGTTANVLYDDDKVTRPIPFAELTLVTKSTYVVGEKVMAVWSSGKFYAGTVTAVKPGDIYTVKWDDGSAPSDVEAAKIFKP